MQHTHLRVAAAALVAIFSCCSFAAGADTTSLERKGVWDETVSDSSEGGEGSSSSSASAGEGVVAPAGASPNDDVEEENTGSEDSEAEETSGRVSQVQSGGSTDEVVRAGESTRPDERNKRRTGGLNISDDWFLGAFTDKQGLGSSREVAAEDALAESLMISDWEKEKEALRRYYLSREAIAKKRKFMAAAIGSFGLAVALVAAGIFATKRWRHHRQMLREVEDPPVVLTGRKPRDPEW